MQKDYEQAFINIRKAAKNDDIKHFVMGEKSNIIKCLAAFDDVSNEKYFLRGDGDKIEFVNSKFFFAIVGASKVRKLAEAFGYERINSKSSKSGKYAGQIMYVKRDEPNVN